MTAHDDPVHEDQAERGVRVRKQDERRAATTAPRARRCNARVKIPARSPDEGDVLFTCIMQSHKSEAGHAEVGRIRLKDGRVVRYTFTWEESPGREVWRHE